jgi:hypothetical protein
MEIRLRSVKKTMGEHEKSVAEREKKRLRSVKNQLQRMKNRLQSGVFSIKLFWHKVFFDKFASGLALFQDKQWLSRQAATRDWPRAVLYFLAAVEADGHSRHFDVPTPSVERSDTTGLIRR